MDATEEQVQSAMEGLVRQLWTSYPMTDLVFLYGLPKDFCPSYQQGKLPPVIQWHEKVAEHYGVPSVNMGQFAAQKILAGQPKANGLTISPDGKFIYQPSFASESLTGKRQQVILKFPTDMYSEGTTSLAVKREHQHLFALSPEINHFFHGGAYFWMLLTREPLNSFIKLSQVPARTRPIDKPFTTLMVVFRFFVFLPSVSECFIGRTQCFAQDLLTPVARTAGSQEKREELFIRDTDSPLLFFVLNAGPVKSFPP